MRIVDDHYKSKGIQISPDEKWIYIADFGGRKVYRYELLAPGVLGRQGGVHRPHVRRVDAGRAGQSLHQHGDGRCGRVRLQPGG